METAEAPPRAGLRVPPGRAPARRLPRRPRRSRLVGDAPGGAPAPAHRRGRPLAPSRSSSRARDLRPRGAMARHRPAGGCRDDARRDLSPDDRRLHGEQRPARPQRGRPPRVPARAPRRDQEAVVLGTVVAERLLDAVALGLLFAVVAFGLLRERPRPRRPGACSRPRRWSRIRRPWHPRARRRLAEMERSRASVVSCARSLRRRASSRAGTARPPGLSPSPCGSRGVGVPRGRRVSGSSWGARRRLRHGAHELFALVPAAPAVGHVRRRRRSRWARST